MSLLTFANAQHDYLQAALAAVRAEIEFRPLQRWQERLPQRVSEQIGDWLELVAALEEADNANYARARQEPEWDFAAADAESERQLRAALTLGQRYLSLCEQLAQMGLTIARQAELAERVKELDDILNWSDDYADTPAYRRLAEETWNDYVAGRVEEGGWE